MANQIYIVSTSAELLNLLLSHPNGGIDIFLKPGNYNLALSKWQGADITYAAPVTIASADPSHPAVFTGLSVANTANLTFNNLVFDMTAPVSKTSTTYRAFSITDSSDIAVTNSVFDGDIATGVSADQNGYGTGIGLFLVRTADVTIAGNQFRNFFTGLSVNDSKGVTISGNDIHSMANDGIVIADVQGLVIEDNYLHNFVWSPKSSYHHDMIQFFTEGTTEPTVDVVIRGNTIDIGDGQWTQSIFLHNEAVNVGAGTGMYFRNILIENNTIYNSHQHGIYLDYGTGVTIRNNTLVQVKDSHIDTSVNPVVWVPGISVGSGSIDVTIVDNVTGSIATTSGKGSWNVAGNVIIQNSTPAAGNFYEDVFLSSSLTIGENSNHAWIVTPGSAIGMAGASLQILGSAAKGVNATFDITTGDTSYHTMIFDAAYTMGEKGALPDKGTAYLWDFGDGTTATGVLVAHSYADTGNYQVTLTVTTSEGLTDTVTGTARITSDTIVSYDETTGRFVADRYGQTVVLTAPPGTGSLDLGAAGAIASISRDDLSAFFGTDEFTMSLTLKSDGESNDYGEIARLHQTFILSVDKSGALIFSLTTSDGTLKLSSTGFNMLDGKAHNIDIHYSDSAEVIEILADGAVVASGHLTGTLPARASWGLTIGNPWNSKNFEGTLLHFSLDVPDQSYYEDYRGDLASVPDGGAAPLVDLNMILADSGAEAIALDGSGVKASYARSQLGALYGAEEFDLSLTLQSDSSADNQGNIVMMHQMFSLSVDAKGNLIAKLTTQEGNWILKSQGFNMNDGFAHELMLHYDGKAGVVALAIDGKLAASAAATGDLIELGYWNLDFGNPWIGENFTSTITEFSLGTTDDRDTAAVATMSARATAPADPVFDDYVLDVAAFVAKGDEGTVIGGKDGYRSLPPITDFIGSDRIGISLNFTRAEADGSSGVLLTSVGNLIVTLEGDGSVVTFRSHGLGLNSTDTNQLIVLLDTEADHLQVIDNHNIAIDEQDTDFVFSRGLGQSWYLGSPWVTSAEGKVTDFRLDDNFSFIDLYNAHDFFLV